MKYLDSVKELIGNTPIIKLNNLDIKPRVNIFAKLENYNPGGSVKDRIGVYMIKQAEKEGRLRPGYTIVEATAGNTGIGVALAAINKGYNIIFVVPEKFSVEKQALMRALGATIINTPRKAGMLGAVEKAEELLKTIENSISLRQFENKSNPFAHYGTTGPEIYEAMDGKIDYFVCGAGSGGTFTGVTKFLKEKNLNIKGILADPQGSTMGGGREGCYDIEGIGNNFIPNTMDMSLVNQVIKVTDEEAYEMVKVLALKEGLIVGSSSGAAVAASLKLANQIDRGNIITVLPDRGDRYFSKNIY
ncbi:O-acetylserine dependent cystathionine beta-synthase [Clostridium argentinense CDC 2741]|uniref:O-acetylserine (thiol)-lyase n=1 Tax=Clostridium argentinense CDC 2741 TaxID=1418104 RepID=A0A0C1UG43_9CLOT|nr:cysteine synthase family protein [Clostridium argentinense]ARC86011.1 cysteine synthase [Clostridium argentinense]KIE46365.1 O-acetylserine dependent cystathionine beta-synthase [Clostridium argentinense CDC 2741]NFF38945.1 cysteine synthase family protein [Clostridium argentinense]NFP48737.1 cysteine synthase family protein [Clostridium argentinense]NFP70995.1 cysteine synthase family protein [Clostridium argentinense]